MLKTQTFSKSLSKFATSVCNESRVMVIWSKKRETFLKFFINFIGGYRFADAELAKSTKTIDKTENDGWSGAFGDLSPLDYGNWPQKSQIAGYLISFLERKNIVSRIVLYWVLYCVLCIVLYHVLYCIVLYRILCIVLYWVFYCIVSQNVLYCIVLYCIVLYCIVLYCIL